MGFLLTLHIIVCIFLVAVILIQPGKGDAGIGFGSSSQSIFGSKGAGNFLTKLTTACAVIFLTTSFILTRTRLQEYNRSVIPATDEAVEQSTTGEPKDQEAAAKSEAKPSGVDTAPAKTEKK